MKRMIWTISAVLCLSGSAAWAIPCPGNGAKIKVVINNPTAVTGQQVSLSGRVLDNKNTCTGQSDTYSTTVTLSSIGDNEFVIPAGGGLNSGIWVHQVAAGEQLQNQKGVVLFAANPSDYAVVRWTYYPAVVAVNKAGDFVSATCPPACNFRQAIARANSLATGNAPVLVQFTVSPGNMLQTGQIAIGSSSTSPITIDGTNTNGAPSIVGDPLAAAMGNQDVFPRIVDLQNKTNLLIRGDNVTVKGLEIRNTTDAQSIPAFPLVVNEGGNTLIESVRLHGGAKLACGVDCELFDKDLVQITDGNASIVNIEGRAAHTNGIYAPFTSGVNEIRDSWLHHNYARGIFADGALLSGNTIELSGRQFVTETVRFNGAVGIDGLHTGQILTDQNVLQNNAQNGIRAPYSVFGTSLSRDIVCGNGQGLFGGADQSGLYFEHGGGGLASAASSGLGVVYNAGDGLNARPVFLLGGLNFDGGNAFTANAGCGLVNRSGHTMSAINNQWRGMTTSSCQSSPDVCPVNGAIVCDPVMDGPDSLIVVHGTYPTNAILKGQTVRLQGSGFNAIAGNPLAGGVGCATGASDIGASNCCRSTNRANVCVSNPSGAPLPPTDGSNCVALRNAVNTWRPAPVTGVSPEGIVAQIPNDQFECLGGSGEIVRVVKLNGGGTPLSDQTGYCTNQ